MAGGGLKQQEPFRVLPTSRTPLQLHHQFQQSNLQVLSHKTYGMSVTPQSLWCMALLSALPHSCLCSNQAQARLTDKRCIQWVHGRVYRYQGTGLLFRGIGQWLPSLQSPLPALQSMLYEVLSLLQYYYTPHAPTPMPACATSDVSPYVGIQASLPVHALPFCFPNRQKCVEPSWTHYCLSDTHTIFTWQPFLWSHRQSWLPSRI